jgi:biopolymer transport protein ExbD
MRFQRNARIFRGQLDAAPFAAVFFLLVIFMMLSSLVYTPGVRVQLPRANDLPGTDKASVSVAIEKNGRLYYQNEPIAEPELRSRLTRVVKSSSEPLTLLVRADEDVPCKMLINLSLLARESGFADALLATLPRPVAAPAARTKP